MNNRRSSGKRPDRSHGATPYKKPPARPYYGKPDGYKGTSRSAKPAGPGTTKPNFAEKWPSRPTEIDLESEDDIIEYEPVPSRVKKGPFRILIAIHRPRYRGRTERAAAVPEWDVTSLLNKQDPVGQVQKGPSPPEILIISSDFGRQKSFGIVKAVQAYRSKGMKIVCLVDTLDADPSGIDPASIADICLTPPYKTADLRALFCRIYEQIRGVPAPASATYVSIDDNEDDTKSEPE